MFTNKPIHCCCSTFAKYYIWERFSIHIFLDYPLGNVSAQDKLWYYGSSTLLKLYYSMWVCCWYLARCSLIGEPLNLRRPKLFNYCSQFIHSYNNFSFSLLSWKKYKKVSNVDFLLWTIVCFRSLNTFTNKLIQILSSKLILDVANS